MALWNDFPYTNFHEQNDDWILRTIKKLVDDFEKISIGFNELDTKFENFKEYVYNELQNVDLYPAVSKKIDEMIADGSFTNLLSNANEKFPLDFNRIFRLHIKGGRYTENPTGITGFQGIAIDGAGNFYFTATKQPYENETGNELGYIYKTDRNGNITSIVTDAKIGHGNSLAFSVKDNKLMCANLHGKLTVYDSNLNLLSTFTLPFETFSVSYDHSKNMPLVISAGTIYRMDLVNGIYIKLSDFTIGSEWTTRQNYSVQGNYIYSVDSNPNSLAKFDRLTGRTIYIQNFYDTIALYKVGELESMCCDAIGNIYLLSYVHSNDKFIVNVFKSNINYSAKGTNAYSSSDFYNDVVVDATISVPSPDGTANKPFSSIEDALCYRYNISRINFAKKCQCLDEYIYVNDNPQINISAKGSVFGGIQWTTSNGGIYDIEIDNANITNPVFTAPVNFYRSKILIDNIKVKSAKETTNLIRINNCLATIIRTDFINALVGNVTGHIVSFGGGYLSSSESFCRGVFRDSEGCNTSPARFTGSILDGVTEVNEQQFGFLASNWGFCNFICRMNDGSTMNMMRNLNNRYEIISDDQSVKITIDSDFKHFNTTGLGSKQIKQIYAT
jgi:hypothetical protein